jgi:hypothetical protein
LGHAKAGHAQKSGTNPKGEFAFFNVVYEDDSQRSIAPASTPSTLPDGQQVG